MTQALRLICGLLLVSPFVAITVIVLYGIGGWFIFVVLAAFCVIALLWMIGLSLLEDWWKGVKP